MGRVRAHSPHIRWTADEIAAVKALYPAATKDALLAALPGRDIRKIQCKANEMGLARLKPPPRTPEQVREAKRNSMAATRARDPEGARGKRRVWVEANRDRVRHKVRTYHQRRFFWGKACRLRREDGPAATHKELASAWKKQRGICALTGERLTRENAELDHILPKVRGGNGHISNLRWVTKQANRAKRDLTDAEFFTLCANVMRWIGERIALVEDLKDG